MRSEYDEWATLPVDFSELAHALVRPDRLGRGYARTRCGPYLRDRSNDEQSSHERRERAQASEPGERSGARGPRERASRGVRGAKPLG